MGKFLIVASIVVAIGLVAFGLVVRSGGPKPEAPQVVSMVDSAAAMQQAGQAMQAHGQAMIAQGHRSGDADLAAYGQTYVTDGQALVQGGQWMAMNPLAPGNLVATPAQLQQQGNWPLLTQGAQAMLHDPTKAKTVDLQALRWDGMAMVSEGQLMTQHGQLMAQQVDLMVSRHGLPDDDATALRGAARTLQDIGGKLTQNGQSMVDFASKLMG